MFERSRFRSRLLIGFTLGRAGAFAGRRWRRSPGRRRSDWRSPLTGQSRVHFADCPRGRRRHAGFGGELSEFARRSVAALAIAFLVPALGS